MKIYKLTHFHDVAEHPDDYLDIGHHDSEEHPPVLWAFIKGKFMTHETDENVYLHDQWLYNEMGLVPKEIYQTFFGRFDPTTNKVSLAYPTGFYPKRVPNILMRQLYKTFGPQIQIFAYN